MTLNNRPMDEVLAKNMDNLHVTEDKSANEPGRDGRDELEPYQDLLEATDIQGKDVAIDNEELRITPLIWWDVKRNLDDTGTKEVLKQYAVLGHESSPSTQGTLHQPVLLNTKSPWSAFLCGSQGSGKSHTLACMLENCLLDDSKIGKTPHPLAGLILHYDGSRGT
jgi:hypothetical protein